MLKNLPLSSEYKRKMKIFNEGRAYYHNKQIKEKRDVFSIPAILYLLKKNN